MNDRAWVATRKGLFELRHSAGRWAIAKHSFIGEPVSMLLPPQASGRVLAALNLGHFGVKVHASDDSGQTWHEVATPSYPPQPETAPGAAAGAAWKLVQIWSMEAAGGTVWAGTLPGGLFRSADGGESWSLVESLWTKPERAEWFGGGYDVPGIHSICAHPQRPGEVLLGLSCGGAWRSEDDGVHWALSARGMRAGFMPPERADDQNDGDTAWFVPAIADQTRIPRDGALVVNRTRDGGRSFETLRSGLPQADAYDLVYRHGLAVGTGGDRLLMGSTTGHLWASDDAGDHWSAVGEHLPPIYAVRFG